MFFLLYLQNKQIVPPYLQLWPKQKNEKEIYCMTLTKMKRSYKKMLSLFFAGIMLFGMIYTAPVSAASTAYTLTTAQFNSAVSNGFPADYRTEADYFYSEFIISALPILQSAGYCTDAKVVNGVPNSACFDHFINFCYIMGEKRNISPTSKFGRAFYNEVSNHSTHTATTCISEMKGMADVLRNRAKNNYNNKGTNYLSQFDGESMFNGISMKSWDEWGTRIQQIIRDAAGNDRARTSLVVAYALAKIRSEEYIKQALGSETIDQSINFSNVPSTHNYFIERTGLTPKPGDNLVVIGKFTFSKLYYGN